MALKESVTSYAKLSEQLEAKKQEFAEKKRAFEKENEELLNEIDSLNETVKSKKSEVEQNALSEYKETGEKKLYGGIGVQNRTEISYSLTEAFNWAKKHDMFLLLDKKAFEKAAPSLEEKLKGVADIRKEPKVTFPKQIKLEEEG